MSNRKTEITARLKALYQEREALEAELKAICTREHQAVVDRLAHLPRDLESLSTWWKENKVTRDQIEQLWDLCWGVEKGDYLTYHGKNVFDHIQGMLDDAKVEDCMAEIYFDLQSCTFKGAFPYDDEHAQCEAKKWRTKKTTFCAFAK